MWAVWSGVRLISVQIEVWEVDWDGSEEEGSDVLAPEESFNALGEGHDRRKVLAVGTAEGRL